jgi:hypothetical protein
VRWRALDFGQFKKELSGVFAGARTTPTGWRKVNANVPMRACAVVRQIRIAAFNLYFYHCQGVD